jgi:hypothetical protein
MSEEIEEVPTEEPVAEEVVEEQVEETATEEVEEVVEEEVEQPVEEEPKPEKPSLPKGVQRRIDKITRQKYEAERRAEALEAQLQQRPAPQAQPQANAEKPTLEQFDYDDAAYIEALTDWKLEQKLTAERKQNAEAQRRSQQEQVYQDFESKRQATLTQGVTKYEDFEEVVIDNPEVVITPQMADIITDSEIGHEIAYYLGSNTAESESISKLSPLKQAAAIAKLENKLASKPAKKISSAPEPIKPVGAKGTVTNNLDPSKDFKKWAEARNKEEYGR